MKSNLLSAPNNDLVSFSFAGMVFKKTRDLVYSRPKVNQIARISCLVLAFLSFGLVSPVNAQPANTDDRKSIILLEDIEVQLECNQALADLYNFKFDRAEEKFKSLKSRYGWHPLPYFLMGLIEWWKIMPNTKNTAYDDSFLAYMDTTINVAEKLYDDYPKYKVEAAFFMAAAYGFKGRLYSDEERKNWRKAASAGKNALDYLDESRGQHNLSEELIFGDALYNYFSVWVPENYPTLKPLLWFFKKGDKELGLKQLKEVSYNAFYTRTEAMVWLMRIQNSYENNQFEAMQISQYLYENYPDNPFFHRYYARMLYSMGRFTDADTVCRSILRKIESKQIGYEATSGRYASFFLGQIYEARKKLDEAKIYYNQCIKFAEEIEATDSGYYLYSLIALGEISEKQGDKKAAKKYFELAKKRSNRKDEAFKDARRRLKKLEKGD